MCSERALALYIVGISLGGWQDMYTERLVDSVVCGPHLLRMAYSWETVWDVQKRRSGEALTGGVL